MGYYCPYCGSKFIHIASREERLELLKEEKEVPKDIQEAIQNEEKKWKPTFGTAISYVRYLACPKCKALRRLIERLNMFEYIGMLTDEFIDILIRAKFGE